VTAPPSRPACPLGAARRRRQGWSPLGDHPKGSALTPASTAPPSSSRGNLVRCTWEGLGGPLLQAFGPKEGRALSRGKGAARPSRLRRLVRSGNGPFRGRSRLAMPIIISGVSGCQVIQSCLHASKIAQEGPYRIDQRRRIVDGRSDRPKLTARERSVSLARGRHGL